MRLQLFHVLPPFVDHWVTKPKRKLTTNQKTEKAKVMTFFINGKQKRVWRPVLIDDSIALHQDICGYA